MTTIEKIHAEFEVDLVGLFSDLNANGPVLDKIKPQSIPATVFREMLTDLQIRYPSYNYISKQQVKDICLKYKLVAAPAFLFNKSIPEKNLIEIDHFQLQQPERMHSIYPTLPGAPDTEVITMRSQVKPPTDLSTGLHIFNFNQYIQVVISGGYYTLYLYDSADLGTPVILERKHVSKLHIVADRSGIYCVINLLRSRLQQGFFVDYAERSTPIMVAPAGDFVPHPLSGIYLGPCEGGAYVLPHVPNQHIERQISYSEGGKAKRDFLKGAQRKADEKLRREQRAAKEAEQKAAAQRKFLENQIKDPIILQPLPVGGFLVVSKWGAEANLPEVQNAISN